MAADSAPILVLGRAADAEVLLRAVESGAVRKIWPAGILSPSPADQGQSVRGVSVLGTLDDLESVVGDFAAPGRPVGGLVLSPSAPPPKQAPETIGGKGTSAGLPTSR